MIVKATKSKAWAEALEKNNWTPALLTGAGVRQASSTTSSPACAR